ncbi:MAG: hypothetical protein AMXMBFR46_28800 [Acidimicrobiia bacterium]
MKFGAVLRLLRMDANLSLRELARQVGVSSAYISRIENGRDPSPTPERLRAIADTLGVPRVLLFELAHQTGPVLGAYLARVPAGGALMLEIARRDLDQDQLRELRQLLDARFPRPDSGLRPRSFGELIRPERVVLDLACTTLEDLVMVAVARLPAMDELGGPSREVLAERIRQREREASTALGGGLMAPHAIVTGATPSAALLTLATPLDVPTPDGAPVRLAIVLVSDAPGELHLRALGRIARLAAWDAVPELVAQRTAEHVLAVLERLESHW